MNRKEFFILFLEKNWLLCVSKAFEKSTIYFTPQGMFTVLFMNHIIDHLLLNLLVRGF